MKTLRFLCCVVFAVVAGVVRPPSAAALDIPRKAPGFWTIEVRWRAMLGGEYIATINKMGDRPHNIELVIKFGTRAKARKDYRTNYVGEPSAEDAAMIYRAAVDTLNDFSFPAEFPNWMDGSVANLELQINQRTLGAEYTYAKLETLPSGLRKIMSFCAKRIPNAEAERNYHEIHGTALIFTQ